MKRFTPVEILKLTVAIFSMILLAGCMTQHAASDYHPNSFRDVRWGNKRR